MIENIRVILQFIMTFGRELVVLLIKPSMFGVGLETLNLIVHKTLNHIRGVHVPRTLIMDLIPSNRVVYLAKS